MQPIAVAQGKDDFADEHLRARVLGSHTRHDFGAFLGSDRVHHKVLRPLPWREQGPFVRNILLAGLAHDPGQRNLFLPCNVLKSLVDLGWEADGGAHSCTLERCWFFFSFSASGQRLARWLALYHHNSPYR